MSPQQKLCDSCRMNFDTMSQYAFNEHIMKHQDKNHKCDKCKNHFHTAKLLRYHMLKVHCKKAILVLEEICKGGSGTTL